MPSEFNADKDLELPDGDAENVVGGHMTSRKKSSASKKHTAHQTPAVTSVLVSGAPLSGDPGVPPGESQAELDSDPDC